ncbi:MAG: aldehyde dehydrogenase family protein [Gammaproteobacteria bacterium]|nr:aldehyde dehydrogenase family protein [Gammaproteobacteria bacterium]
MAMEAGDTCRSIVSDVSQKTKPDMVFKRARAAAEKMRTMDFESRVQILRSAEAAMRAGADELVNSMIDETAIPLRHARDLFAMSLKKLNYSYGYLSQMGTDCYPELQSDRVAFTLSEPFGIVFAVFPFITPLYLAAEIFTAAIITGNTIVYHAPEEVSDSFSKMRDIFIEAGVPEDALISLTCVTSEDVVRAAQHPEIDIVVSMAGSYGRALSSAAGGALKQAWLSITGKNPTLVFEDADVDLAARETAWSANFISGLVCTDTELVLVQRSIAKEFKEKLVEYVKQLRVGDPWDESVDVGPIVFPRIVENATRQLSEAVAAGAKVVCGGEVNGAYFQPTVLEGVRPDMAIAQERTSAPITPLVEFSREEEAIALANNNPYGLRASVFTRDLARAFRVVGQIKAGGIMVNHAPFHHEATYPSGGYKQSGLGTLRYLIEELRRKKLVVFHNVPMAGFAAS